MARVPRHTHHSRKARSNWAVTGAFVASATFAPRIAPAVHGAELTRSLESLRIAVPAETRIALRKQATGPADSERPESFDIAAGPLRTVLTEFERITRLRVVSADASVLYGVINRVDAFGLELLEVHQAEERPAP